MYDRDKENLAELIERLYHGERAGIVLEDYRKGEQILRENQSPEPAQTLIANIKAEIALLIPARRARLARRRMYRRAAVAAALIIIIGIGMSILDERDSETVKVATAGLIPTKIWESNNIASDDEKLSIFTAQIDQIENEVINLESGNDTGYSSDRWVEEMEIELIVVRNAFWKE